jgi:hypothetical protein
VLLCEPKPQNPVEAAAAELSARHVVAETSSPNRCSRQQVKQQRRPPMGRRFHSGYCGAIRSLLHIDYGKLLHCRRDFDPAWEVFGMRVPLSAYALSAAMVFAAAAGCAHRFELNMTEDLNRFVGKDIHVAIAELGYPAKEDTIAGDHIFRWGINVGATSIGTSNGILGMSKTKATGCLVDLVVDNTNIVTRASWSGTKSACEDLEDRLWSAAHR